MRHKIVFILVFGPALLAYPVGFVVTAFRLAFLRGRDDAVITLARKLAEKGRRS